MAAVPDPARQAFRILRVGFDVALRDFGLSLGALALARLAEAFAPAAAPADAGRRR
jgi:hypothetical protein